MRYLPVILIAGLVTSVVTLADKSAPRKTTAPAPMCDTVFDGVAGGDLSDAANWTNGLADLLAEKGVTVDWLQERLAAGSEA